MIFQMKQLAILIIAAIFSCKKEEQQIIIKPCELCDTVKPYVWIHMFDTLSGQKMLAVDPVMYKGNPVYVLHDPFSCNFGSAQRITCLDSETGSKLWGFDLPDTCGTLNNAYLHEDILLINTKHLVMGYDLRTKRLAWEIPIEKPRTSSIGLSGIKGKAYLSINYGSIPDFQATAILEIDMITGAYREICHVDKDEAQGYPSFNPPSFWQNARGDSSFLFMTMGRYHYSLHPDKETYALLAYDLKKEELIWVADSIGYPTNDFRRVEIYENNVLLPVGSGVQCYDIPTGNKLWEKTMPCCAQYNASFASSRLLAASDRVIACTNSTMYCLDISSGKILWKEDKYASNGNNDLLLHNEVVYMASSGSGRLVGVDLFTGQLLMKEPSPNKSTNITKTNVLLNKEKNLLYAFDFVSAIAFKPAR